MLAGCSATLFFDVCAMESMSRELSRSSLTGGEEWYDAAEEFKVDHKNDASIETTIQETPPSSQHGSESESRRESSVIEPVPTPHEEIGAEKVVESSDFNPHFCYNPPADSPADVTSVSSCAANSSNIAEPNAVASTAESSSCAQTSEAVPANDSSVPATEERNSSPQPSPLSNDQHTSFPRLTIIISSPDPAPIIPTFVHSEPSSAPNITPALAETIRAHEIGRKSLQELLDEASKERSTEMNPLPYAETQLHDQQTPVTPATPKTPSTHRCITPPISQAAFELTSNPPLQFTPKHRRQPSDSLATAPQATPAPDTKKERPQTWKDKLNNFFCGCFKPQ